MPISDRGFDLIKAYERLRLKAYLPTPDDVWTVGYGHTKDVQEGDEVTEDEADAFLREDVKSAEDCIDTYVEAELTQNQYDALCSFIFNIGCGNFKGSTLCKLINAGNFEAAQKQFARWNKQNGKPLAGLTRRRAEEAALFAET